ncbi:MAG: hypothetical protein ACK5L3_06690 [Oscillospiraceae bacterium]
MFEKILGFIKRVIAVFTADEAKKISKDIKVSDKMANAINSWFQVFYNVPPWHGQTKGKARFQTKMGAVLTAYMATLATNEITVSAGTGTRADFIVGQLTEFVIADMQETVQLAGIGGEVVLKPYVRRSSVMCEVVPAMRFYPTRIVGKVVEAAIFADYAKLHGLDVVRIESHDLQPDGVHITNKAFYKDSGGPVALTDVPEWADIAPEIHIGNVDIPLYAVIRMPYPNIIDPASKLPVSMYANSMDTLAEMDRIYSEFLWEIHTGKRRQIFDSTAIKSTLPGTGLEYKDMASDQYIALNMAGGAKLGAEGKPYDDYTPDMRVDAYQTAMDIQLRLLEMQCNISPGTFSFDIKTGQAKTATEIISQDKTTYNTIKAIQERGMLQALKALVEIYDIYTSLYSLAPNGNIEASVSFGDSIFEDTATEFARRMILQNAGNIRPELNNAWYFGVDEKAALAMMSVKNDKKLFGEEA